MSDVHFEGEEGSRKFDRNNKNVMLNNQGTVNIIEPTELGESLKNLMSDDIDNQTKMSGIDMRTILHSSEISGILAVDTLVAFKYLPSTVLTYTRQMKRLAVSKNGKGREQVVEIAAGKVAEKRAGGGGMLSRFFGTGKKEA